MKVHISPNPEDAHDGVRRVLEAQFRYLSDFGVEIVGDPASADVINGHVLAAPNVSGIPLVHSNHGLYWSKHNWPHQLGQINQGIIDIATRAQIVTTPSKWVAHALERGLWIKPTVIHHGVDADQWKPMDKPNNYVLWNKGRGDPVSDPRDVSELAPLLPNVEFLITIGSGNPSPNIKIIGRVPYEKMNEMVANAGVYLATARETFGIGTLEALACGVPVAGWDHGGQSEIIIPGETGYLAPFGDYPALVECVIKCFEQRKRLSINARDDVLLRWLWPDKIEQYAEAYREAVGQTSTKTKVSVIVTCYNLADYLEDCLHSVISQSFGDWECIIVDDSSEDETPAIAEAWAKADPRFSYIRTAQNIGLSGARNYGFDKSSGQYVLNLDADDMLTVDALLQLSNSLDEDSSISIAYGHLDIVNNEGKEARRNDWPGEFNWYQQMAHMNQLPYCGMMRRSVWERTGGYRVRDWRAEDASFWCRATTFGAKARKVTEESILLYRIRPDSKGQMERAKHADGDGDWTSFFPWRIGARTAEEGYSMLQKGKLQDPALVPLGAQGERQDNMSWPAHSHHTPMVSIIIPVGPSHAPYLVDALDSVMAQTYPFWEAVVVNDTGQDLEAAPWVVMVKGGKGIAASRTNGIESAKAPLLLFLDCDDMLLPTALENMIKEYVSVEGSRYIYTDWYGVNTENKVEIKKSKDYNQHTWRGMHPISILIPREWAKAVNGFDPSLPGWEDWDFFLKLAINGYCGHRLAKPLLLYRTGTGERREQSLDDADEILPILDERYGRYYKGPEKIDMTGCCGGNSETIIAAQNRFKGLMGATQQMERVPMSSGLIRMEYVGQNKGAITFKKPGLTKPYRGGNNAVDRYIDANPADVDILETTGKWKQVRSVTAIEIQAPVEAYSPPEPAPVREMLKDPADLTIAELKKYAMPLGSISLKKLIEGETGGRNRKTAVKALTDMLSVVERVG